MAQAVGGEIDLRLTPANLRSPEEGALLNLRERVATPNSARFNTILPMTRWVIGTFRSLFPFPIIESHTTPSSLQTSLPRTDVASAIRRPAVSIRKNAIRACTGAVCGSSSRRACAACPEGNAPCAYRASACRTGDRDRHTDWARRCAQQPVIEGGCSRDHPR